MLEILWETTVSYMEFLISMYAFIFFKSQDHYSFHPRWFRSAFHFMGQILQSIELIASMI